VAPIHKPKIKPPVIIAIGVASILLFLLMGIVLDFFVARFEAQQASQSAIATSQQHIEEAQAVAIAASQRSFCSIINLQVQALRENPPPPGNPSRKIIYQAYQDFLILQRKFGC